MGEAEVEQEHSETEPICVNSGQAVYAQQSLWSGLIWYFKFISRNTFKFESVFSFQHAFFACLFTAIPNIQGVAICRTILIEFLK